MRGIGRLRLLIFRKRNAYRALFRPGGQLSTAAGIVLEDLREFCRATRSTAVVSLVSGKVDPIASAIAEGRREVWLRITQNLNIDDADLYALDPEGKRLQAAENQDEE